MPSTTLRYNDGELELLGYLASPDSGATPRPRPGVLVMPPGSGLGAGTKRVVERLAGMGFVALGGDPFGHGAVAGNYEEAERFASLFSDDPVRFRRRVQVSLDALCALPQVDKGRLAAIGYCMGGTFVLELARSGAPLAAVVTFHGILQPKIAATEGSVRAEILVCTGAKDPFVPPGHVAAFTEEMTAAGANWQVISYAGAQHSFTNPDAGAYGRPGLAYDQNADRHSWAAMASLLKRTLGMSD